LPLYGANITLLPADGLVLVPFAAGDEIKIAEEFMRCEAHPAERPSSSPLSEGGPAGLAGENALLLSICP